MTQEELDNLDRQVRQAEYQELRERVAKANPQIEEGPHYYVTEVTATGHPHEEIYDEPVTNDELAF